MRGSSFAVAPAGLLVLGLASPSLAEVAYLRSAVDAPWDSATNEQAMTLAFGEGAWQDLRYETVDPAALLSPAYHFLYLEGSDDNADELEAFLTANRAAIELWVERGGRLLLNAAPNEGDGMAFGFGGVTLELGFSADPVTMIDPSHPAFAGEALAASYTGRHVAHGQLVGGDLVPLLVDGDGAVTLAELPQHGCGAAVFGALTTSNFWSPTVDALDLRTRVIVHLASRTIASADDADCDSVANSDDNCPFAYNLDQADGDGDGVGDACDESDGNDGVGDACDPGQRPAGDDGIDGGCSASGGGAAGGALWGLLALALAARRRRGQV
jgi:MYXO-CTERM domain-containing protein